MMTRKHFDRLANIIKAIEDEEEMARLALEIGQMCAEDNPNFNWGYWYEGCGVITINLH